jgi:glycosyltransferase involved in cell wall biosynthesis
MLDIFIIIPSLSPVGPVKGAIALANALVSKRSVALVILKPGPGAQSPINSKVKIISLYKIDGWFKRLNAYKQYLKKAGGKEKVASLSSCFSPDVFNLLCRKHAIICSSVRANNLHNYRLDYGWKGTVLAIFHLFILRGFNHVVAMTEAMSKQVANYLGRLPVVIGNFIDEVALEQFQYNTCNEEEFRFVFVGSLTERKRPSLLLHAVKTLNLQGHKVKVDFIGDGPLKNSLDEDIVKNNLSKIVCIHGHLDKLHHIVASADVFVLPSLSEGLSRAGLEALYLGVPVVMRDVDGNSELVESGVNGFLFNDDSELCNVMLSAVKLAREQQGAAVSLLPLRYGQSFAAQSYLDLVEKKL